MQRHLFMMWRHRCKQHGFSVGDTITANTELPQPELPGVMRVTPAGVTLVVVGEPTLYCLCNGTWACELPSSSFFTHRHSAPLPHTGHTSAALAASSPSTNPPSTSSSSYLGHRTAATLQPRPPLLSHVSPWCLQDRGTPSENASVIVYGWTIDDLSLRI